MAIPVAIQMAQRGLVMMAAVALCLCFAACGCGEDRDQAPRDESLGYFQAEPHGWTTDELWWRDEGWAAGVVGLVLHHANITGNAAVGVHEPRAVIANVFPTGEVYVSGNLSWPWRVSPYLSIDNEFESIARQFGPMSTWRVLMYGARSAPFETMWALLADWPESAEPREFGVLGLDPQGKSVALVARLSAASANQMEQRLAVKWLSAGGGRLIRFEYGGQAWELPRGGYEIAQARALAALNEFMDSFSARARDLRASSVELALDLGYEDVRIFHVVALLDVLHGAGARTIRIHLRGHGGKAVELDFLD